MSINPISTYRIQFHKDFNFDDFEKIIPYLDKLGIRTIYASPVFEATPGSTHGYDGIDPNNINPEIGTEEQLIRISNELKKRNIYWLQDIVPNHMSYHENNKWLMDVLEKGQSSEYASYFDVIWDHPGFENKLMVPFPGSELEKELTSKFPEGENYVIVHWQDTDHKINYRRFFLVNVLICTNIHNNKVFDHYHSLVKKLSDAKVFDGLRIDHIDGLYDPAKYLNDLRTLVGENSYIVVEKILEPGENMPDDWPVQGNSGYDFLGMVNNIFSSKAAEYKLSSLYFDISGDNKSVEEQVREKKAYILHHYMCGELDNLTRLYKDCQLADDLNDADIKILIADYLISCPVYRYYGDEVPLMKRDEGKKGEGVKKFYNRCMQFTGPLMAKGVEDTLMYTYNRFAGHNEVGDSPEFFGYSIEQFHELMTYRQKHWPFSLNGSSTHDTKRGEDVRARLNAVTCFADEWVSLVRKWMAENNQYKTNGWPDNNDEYFIYQTLIGSYPLSEDNYSARLKDYFQKAFREAKMQTNWAEPNIPYEEACFQFVEKILDQHAEFKKTFKPFLEKIAYYGMYNSFGQLILKFTCPGIPDIYQGTELWDLSLVDPDNRRPVDYLKRSAMLDQQNSFEPLLSTYITGEVKLSLLHKLLQIRNQYSDIFTKGEYVPVNIEGKYKDHVLAFMRKHDRSAILVTVPVTYALIESDSSEAAQIINELIPKNFFQSKLLHIADLFQIIHLDLVA